MIKVNNIPAAPNSANFKPQNFIFTKPQIIAINPRGNPIRGINHAPPIA